MLHLARQGVLAGPAAVPGDARRHRRTTSPRSSTSATGPSTSSACAWSWRRCRTRSTPGRVVEETGPRASRNRLQTITLLDAIEEHRFDAVFGGARRDEEKARAKERVFSFRDEFGQWDPKNQRPELWNLYNGRHRKGEHIRVFPLSNWTELDIWQYIADERHRAAVDLLRAPSARCSERDGMLLAVTPFVTLADGEEPFEADRALPHRRRRDLHRRGRVDRGHGRPRSSPRSRPRASPSAGATRADDRISEAGHGRPQERGLLLMTCATRCTDSGATWNCSLATAGSVDDGKSHAHRAAARTTRRRSSRTSSRRSSARAAQRGDEYTNLALLTDGLRAEREQGITIDVAYRYFATPDRKFIIADTPGHIQYTRNMVTGASTADLALILIDARNGVLEQSRRHAFLAVAAAASRTSCCASTRWTSSTTTRQRFDDDQRRVPPVRHQARRHRPHASSRSRRSTATTSSTGPSNMPWYEGPSLLHHLEDVHIASDRNLIDARFPVQYVIRPQSRRAARLPGLRGHGRGRRAASRATRSSCCRPGSPPRSTVDRHGRRARSRRRSRRCRSRSRSPTTSTSSAAT